MNAPNWPPRIGTYYLRWDKDEVFQVTGYDGIARKAFIQTYDGTPEEIDEATWRRLSPSTADPAEEWTGPVETVDVVRFECDPDDPVSSEDVGGPRPVQD